MADFQLATCAPANQSLTPAFVVQFDSFGKIPDYFGHPFSYVHFNWKAKTAIRAVDVINSRAKLLSVEGTLDKAYDKYGVIRDVWVQQREYQIYDGNPPQPKEDEESYDDEPPAPAGPATPSTKKQ